MRRSLCLVASPAFAWLLAIASLFGAEPAKSATPSAAEKKTPEPASAETSATHKVKREVLKIELSLKGVFEAEPIGQGAQNSFASAGLS